LLLILRVYVVFIEISVLDHKLVKDTYITCEKR